MNRREVEEALPEIPVDTAAEVEQQVRRVFASHPYPEKEQVALRRPGDSCYEGEVAWEFFQGKTWQDVVEFGRENGWCEETFFLTPEGLAYYLPAFLILSLEQDHDAPMDFEDHLTFRLRLPEAEAPDIRTEMFTRLVASLSLRERRSVANVLEHVATRTPRQDPASNPSPHLLETYWGHFLETAPSLRSAKSRGEFRRELAAVFTGRGVAPEDRLFHRRPGGLTGETREAWEAFEGCDWQDLVHRAEEENRHLQPGLLTLEGFAYFLPAFLHLALEPERHEPIRRGTAFLLWMFAEQMGPFWIDAERQVVLRVLKHVAKNWVRREPFWNEAYGALKNLQDNTQQGV